MQIQEVMSNMSRLKSSFDSCTADKRVMLKKENPKTKGPIAALNSTKKTPAAASYAIVETSIGKLFSYLRKNEVTIIFPIKF